MSKITDRASAEKLLDGLVFLCGGDTFVMGMQVALLKPEYATLLLELVKCGVNNPEMQGFVNEFVEENPIELIAQG